MATTLKISPHPWRTKKEFLQIYQKASPSNKYKVKIPKDLVNLRNSLDMREKLNRTMPAREKLLILPQLSAYVPEVIPLESKNPEEPTENEEVETFESCMYVKSERRKKKIDELDEIDK